MADVKTSAVSHVDGINGGRPVFTGTRVPVGRLLEYLEEGSDLEDFLEGFPTVDREQAVDALETIRANIDSIFTAEKALPVDLDVSGLRRMGVILLSGHRVTRRALRPGIPRILAALERVRPGSLETVRL